jgi:hypothetical protein
MVPCHKIAAALGELYRDFSDNKLLLASAAAWVTSGGVPMKFSSSLSVSITSIFEKWNELFHCNDVFFYAGCETGKRQNTNLI